MALAVDAAIARARSADRGAQGARCHVQEQQRTRLARCRPSRRRSQAQAESTRSDTKAISDPAIALLKRLVAIDSVNPSLVAGAAAKQPSRAHWSKSFRQIGLDVHLQEAAPGRPNVIGVLEGRARGRSLMFCGHTDTVGVAGMTRPFDPAERNGRLYGRGSQDMKSGVAAMVAAARQIAESGGLEARAA